MESPLNNPTTERGKILAKKPLRPQRMARVVKVTNLPTVREFDRRKSLTSADRSITYHDLHDFDNEEVPSESTPLLLSQGLDDLLGVPKDKNRAVAVAFFYLGCCTMLPWNFVIAINSFWNYKFRMIYENNTVPVPSYIANNTTLSSIQDQLPLSMAGFHFGAVPSDPKPTEMQLSFPSYVAIASNIPGAITTILHSGYGQRVSVSSRMAWSISLLIAAFTSLLMLSVPNSDMWQMKFMHIVLMLVVLSNVGVNVLQGSMFGASGRFPSIYAGCVMMGQGFGGLIPSAVAVAMITFDVEPKVVGPAAFGFVLALLIGSLACERWLSRNKFFLFFSEGKDNRITGDTSDHNAEVDRICYRDILKRSWIYLISGFLSYTTTLSVFPAVSLLVVSTRKNEWTDKYFTPIGCMLLANSCDVSGRIASTWFQWPRRSLKGQLTYLTFVILKISLIPLIMLCNLAPQERHVPVIFHSDAVFCCLLAILSFGNGYLGNLGLIHAPKTSDMAESQEATSLLLTASFVMGQATGSFLSFFLLRAL